MAIDVNTGRYVGKYNLEETILKTNLEAVKEIVSPSMPCNKPFCKMYFLIKADKKCVKGEKRLTFFDFSRNILEPRVLNRFVLCSRS